MSFDLHILCIMEEKKCRGRRFAFSKKFYFKAMPSKHILTPEQLMDGTWTFLNICCDSGVGNWYYLLPYEDEDEPLPGFLGCYKVCNKHYSQQSRDDYEIYKTLPEGEDYPKFDNLYDEWEYHKSTDLAALEIKPEYREDFGKIIDYFLERSPVKMIIFLPRYQGSERDNVQGVLKRDLFFEMLDTGKIKFNTCYIISNIKDNIGPNGETLVDE